MSKLESPAPDLTSRAPLRLSRDQWIVLAASFLGWMFDGVQIGLFPVLMRPALQSMGIASDADIGRWASWLNASFLLGAAIGGIGFGWLGDKFGRVRAMVVSILTYSLFAGACGMAQTPWQLAVLRFIASLGMGGQWSLAVALVMECWPERHRPKLAGAIGAAANFGIMFIAVAGLIKNITIDQWRWICYVAASPAVLALLIVLFVPESEKWKQSVKRASTVNPLLEIFKPKLLKSTVLAALLSAIPLMGTWAAVSGYIPMWVDQMKQESVAQKLLSPEQIKAYKSVANTPDVRAKKLKELLTPDDFATIRASAAKSKAWSQVALAIGAIVSCFVAPAVGQIWGRRPVYFALSLMSLVSCMYLFNWCTSFNLEFVVMTVIVGGVTAAYYGWLPLFLPELFPTRVRATGQGLSFNIGRVLAAAGTLLMGKFVEMFNGDYGKAMASITLVYIVGMIVIWLAPETKGKPLPE